MPFQRPHAFVRLVVPLALGTALAAQAQHARAPTISAAQQRGMDALMARQKDGQFSYSKGDQVVQDAAITSFGLMALQTKPKQQRSEAEAAAIAKGLETLLKQQNEDGSFGTSLLNYTTCVAVGALVAWGDAAARPAIARAQQCILRFQQMEANGLTTKDRDYGGFSYGGGKSTRADLSNTNMALEALRASGLDVSDDAFLRAVVFLQRTQNLTPSNDFTGTIPNPDPAARPLEFRAGTNGGAFYYPGNSAAGYDITPDGKATPRSYGSMSYALLKAYVLAGVPADDPRMQAVVSWIQANWTLAENPGADAPQAGKAKYQGLFYYYLMVAQALDGRGAATLEVSANDTTRTVDWRAEMRRHLESLQKPDGTWVNDQNDRWMEGVDVLCTCYAMLALERCR